MKNVDAPEVSDVSVTASNVRKDLTEWQEHHATLVLTNVKVRSNVLNPGNFVEFDQIMYRLRRNLLSLMI